MKVRSGGEGKGDGHRPMVFASEAVANGHAVCLDESSVLQDRAIFD